MQTEASDYAERANPFPVITRADGLRCVLNDMQVAAACDFKNRMHISGLAGEMNWQDRLGARRERGLD